MHHFDIDPIDTSEVADRVSCPRCCARSAVALDRVQLRSAAASYTATCRRCSFHWRGEWLAVPDVLRLLEILEPAA